MTQPPDAPTAPAGQTVAEVFPLLWSDDIGRIVGWAQSSLGLELAWQAADDDGRIEHAELRWPGGKISINVRQPDYQALGPAGIALRLDDPGRIEAIHRQAVGAGASIVQPLTTSRVAFSFTAEDPDGNHWWVHAETGFLDELRRSTLADSAGALR